jgi:hypothetical protein
MGTRDEDDFEKSKILLAVIMGIVYLGALLAVVMAFHRS